MNSLQAEIQQTLGTVPNGTTNETPIEASVLRRQPFAPEVLAQAVSAKSQADFWVSNSILLAVLSAASQDGFLIQTPVGVVKPIGLTVCVSSPSGSRKSTALDLAAKPLLEREKSYPELIDQEASKYQTAHKIYKAKASNLLARMQKAEADQIEPLSQELEALEMGRPRPPNKHQRILSNSTIEGLYKHYDQACYGPFVLADEGRQAMDLLMSKNAAILSKLVDGADINITRATARSVNIQSPKFAGLFLLQPGILREQNKKSGESNLASGLIARMLFWQVDTLARSSPCVPTQLDDDAIAALHQRLNALLDYSEQCARGEKTPIVLQLDACATQAFHTAVAALDYERRFAPDISDSAGSYLARAGENIVRMAALIHLLVADDWHSAITEASVNCAIGYSHSYKAQYMQLFEFGGLDQELVDDQALLAQLHRNYWNASFSKSCIHRVAPRMFRGNSKRLDQCIERLINQSSLLKFSAPVYGSRKPSVHYEVNHSRQYIGG